MYWHVLVWEIHTKPTIYGNPVLTQVAPTYPVLSGKGLFKSFVHLNFFTRKYGQNIRSELSKSSNRRTLSWRHPLAIALSGRLTPKKELCRNSLLTAQQLSNGRTVQSKNSIVHFLQLLFLNGQEIEKLLPTAVGRALEVPTDSATRLGQSKKEPRGIHITPWLLFSI